MATQKGRNWSSGDIVTAANLSSVERGVSAVSSLYEPTTWANGDTVTAVALNNIEQGIVNADGGGKSWVTLCEEEVTTIALGNDNVAQLSYSQLISADIIRVTFDEITYTCNIVNQESNETYYGGVSEAGPDFSEYPFGLMSEDAEDNNQAYNTIVAETSGTHTVKIEVLQESSSSDFSTATVTVNPNDSFVELNGFVPVIIDDGGEFITCVDYLENGYNVVLFDGSYILITIVEPMYTVSGNASLETIDPTMPMESTSYKLTITGDCTITVSGESSGDDPIK